jgi:hypothetical protein
LALHPNLAAINQTLATTESRVIRDFLRYMSGLHPADRLPSRAAFDPMALPHLLAHLVLAQVERSADGNLRFLVRVAGELVLRAAPVPLMNRYLETSVNLGPQKDDSEPRIVDVRRQVTETGCMLHWRGKLNMPFRFDFAEVEYVHFPLAEDGRTVDRILSAFHYHGIAEA